jgi:protocatechuate 3,4-dioxygenase, beta subunit
MSSTLFTSVLMVWIVNTGDNVIHGEKAMAKNFYEQNVNDQTTEATLEFGSKTLNGIDTLSDFNEDGPRMVVKGTLYKKDGKPASGIIVYIYHTDQTGVYPKRGEETGWGKRHGYLRGWVKTGNDGKYEFYTLKPAAYPGGGTPAHIHMLVKEPSRNEYPVDAILFEGDPFLKESESNRPNPRGGSGLVKLQQSTDGLLLAKRDIFLD